VSGLDPITRQVIANRLESIPREMAQIVQRTARSTVIVHGKDFSCGLLDAKAQLLATPEGSPVHIFPVVAEVQFIQKKFGREIHQGDVFIANDFSEGGSHLNDVLLCTPLFYEDDLVAFLAVRGHLVDVGGMSPGSITGEAREIFQEGVRIPTVKLYERGKLVQALWEILLFNVRLPDLNAGDLQAMLAGCWMGEKRVREMFARYGKSVVLGAFDEIHSQAEQLMRSRIRALPDGTYVHEDYVDNDGVTADPRMIRVAATVDDDSITMDLAGTAAQSPGPMNMGYGVSTGYALMAGKIALDPGSRVTHGGFRPINVVLPAGSMAAAEPPAAVGSTGTTGSLVTIGLGAFASILPRNVTAGENTSGNHYYLSGYFERGGRRERFIYYDYPSGGAGGTFSKDGVDAAGSLRTGNVEIQPIEVLENAYPVLRFQRWQLRAGSGGPGEFRGGHGQVREYKVEVDGVLSILLSQCMVPPAGLFGGYPGAPNGVKVIRNGEVIDLGAPPYWGKATGFPVKRGDIIRMEMSGGGGYGDPLDRDPLRVAADVRQKLLTRDQARAQYGVVLDPATFAPDESATRKQRHLLRERRLYADVHVHGQPRYRDGAREVQCGASLIGRGISVGDLAEVVSKTHPGPLRARIAPGPAVPVGGVVVDEEAARFFRLKPGDQVELRPLRQETQS
jgi:N-methylhydantoinase B